MNPNLGYRDLLLYLMRNVDASTAALATTLALFVGWIVLIKTKQQKPSTEDSKESTQTGEV